MIIGIQDEILRINSLGLLDRLLADKTTKANILWATDAYGDKGPDYQRDKEITAPLITGQRSGIIKNRARKALEQQSERTRQHAEVFTPVWVCAKMNDYADEVWFGKPEAFTKNGEPTARVDFPKGKGWQRYVDSRRLEITCGEAPYLVSRYDVSTGESIPIERRIGLLDRKLRVVNENAVTEDEWLKWALRAFQATYGYEFQGDNVLISRLNLLTTFEEYLSARWKRKPTKAEYLKIINIITWNLWQMDGLTSAIPYSKTAESYDQISMDDILGINEDARAPNARPPCRVRNWTGGRSVAFAELQTRGNHGMKFDFIIGNPPYQDETGRSNGYAAPIYHLFLEESCRVADAVELIHPARFLFNAGSTPKEWNKKMLNDPHFKVLHYDKDSSNIFANVDIKGGVAITYRDVNKDFGAIETFTSYPALNEILKKVKPKIVSSLSEIAFVTAKFDFTVLFSEVPGCKTILKERRLATNVLDILDGVIFFDEKPRNEDKYIKVFGRKKGSRAYMWVLRRYIDAPENLDKFKIFLPKVNGIGSFGETLTDPVLGYPQEINTHTFMSIGALETEYEGKSLLKYVKSKFARGLLGILKITQHNSNECWRYVPLQDFTPMSDIDWSKSIPEIDQQLYAKYGLDEAEIAFIESHVKEMK